MKKEVFIGLLLSAMAAGAFAQDNAGIYSFNVGSFEVHMLVEVERPGTTEILIDASDALLERYIPRDGFLSSINTFLIKTPQMIILIDTGFGQALLEHMDKLEIAPADVDAILITHLHGDHFGGLQREGRALFPNARVYLSERELEYWTETNVSQAAVAALVPYGGRVETFVPSELGGNLGELFPGIFPIATYGHTPGHTVFLIDNGGEQLLVWGDIMHAAPVQFPKPDISVTYDTNPKAAAVARWQILNYAAKNNISIVGIHLAYPGVGTVDPDGSGGYKFTPAN